MPESLEREYTCTNRLGCNVCSQDVILVRVRHSKSHIWSHDRDLSRFGGMNFKFFFLVASVGGRQKT